MGEEVRCAGCGRAPEPSESGADGNPWRCPACAEDRVAAEARVAWAPAGRNPRHPLPSPAPGVYPSEHPPDERAEAVVWRRFGRQLPKGWYVWHHVKVGRGFHQAEIDFVVAIPGRGVVLVEVKGGAMWRRDGRWHQNGHPMTESPEDQVERARRSLVRDLGRLFQPLPEIAIALCFPETSSPGARDVGGIPILFKEDVEWFELGGRSRLAKAFSGAGRAPDERYVGALHTLWGPDWWPMRPLTRRPDRVEVAWRQLTGEQAVMLSCLDESRRMHVEGPPGSGKTVVLQALAHKLQEAGRRVLVLTFTRAIALELARTGLRGVHPIRDFALREARARSLVDEDDATVSGWPTARWEQMMASVAADLRQAPGKPWDALLVDEAQDLGETDWALVDVLVGETTALWLFGDENQRAMWHAREARVPARLQDAGVFRLRAGLRSPPALLDLATRVLHGAPDAGHGPWDALDEALSIIVLEDKDEASLTRALEATVGGWLAPGDLTPDDVLVISLGTLQRSRLSAWPTLAGHPVRRADDLGEAPAIVADTVLRLKGLERPCVAIVDTDLGSRAGAVWCRALYLALTRASARCVVLTTEDAVRSEAMAGVVARRGVAARGVGR